MAANQQQQQQQQQQALGKKRSSYTVEEKIKWVEDHAQLPEATMARAKVVGIDRSMICKWKKEVSLIEKAIKEEVKKACVRRWSRASFG